MNFCRERLSSNALIPVEYDNDVRERISEMVNVSACRVDAETRACRSADAESVVERLRSVGAGTNGNTVFGI